MAYVAGNCAVADLRIPLPRVPRRVIRTLNRYSDWAAVPVISVIHRRDLVSIAVVVAISGTYAWYVDSWVGFVLGAGACALTWVAIEAWHAA
jgi:hypothetical protein